LKCSVIIYFAAFSSIDKFTVSRSVTQQIVDKGYWKVNCYSNPASDNSLFEDYAFSFEATGKVTATKNGTVTEGRWMEDNISKTITISFNNDTPFEQKLNTKWHINAIDNASISLKNDTRETLLISKL
jgi:hypothetical protein